MPNEYRLKVDTESIPPRAILVDVTGIAVDSTEIQGDSGEASIKAWAAEAATRHEASITAKLAEEAATAAATTAAETLKTALEAETIIV